jgi:hypothetical protein
MIKLVLGFFIVVLVFAGCERSYDPDTQNIQRAYKVFDAYFNVSDSLGNIKTEFQLDQDIVLNFGVINNRDATLSYTKSHGGPPIAFVIFHDNTMIGNSYDGYGYYLNIEYGEIAPRDTLKYSVSWNSNSFHETKLVPGEYTAIVQPHMRFDDFDLNSVLVAVPFKIIE